jgi:oligopeptide/dipeptide ABC transporter ATP-binding protein
VKEVILEMKGLKKHFPLRRGFTLWKDAGAVRAVDGVSVSIARGETFGLVGESGCGKSTIGKLLLRVLEPTEGEIRFMGEDMTHLKTGDLLRMRRHIQAVYQDPYASLNPRMNAGHIIGEPCRTLGFPGGTSREKRVTDLLQKVGLSAEDGRKYPHEFSGGQRQRIGIARALSVNPSFVVLDEPVSALDVSIRSQILNLLADLQKEFHLTYLFISHDLSVVEYICDRVAVMYLGRIVEQSTKRQLFRNPLHPYTRALLSAVPIPDPDCKLELLPLTGEIPSPINPPPGCVFHPRCPEARDQCKRENPPLLSVEDGHLVQCHR